MLELAQKLIYGLTAFLKLKIGLYRKELLPDYDFDSLKDLWPYNPPYCVSDTFSRKEEADIDLSICIPAFNAEKTIITLLEQIERQKQTTRLKFLSSMMALRIRLVNLSGDLLREEKTTICIIRETLAYPPPEIKLLTIPRVVILLL